MKTAPSPSGNPRREAATPTAGETRAPAPDGLNLLVKPGWLHPGIDIDNRNSLYDLFDEDEDLLDEYRP